MLAIVAMWLNVKMLQVRKLLRNEGKLLEKYEEKLLDSYIEDNKSVRWCPSVPHCGCAIQVTQLYRTYCARYSISFRDPCKQDRLCATMPTC